MRDDKFMKAYVQYMDGKISEEEVLEALVGPLPKEEARQATARLEQERASREKAELRAEIKRLEQAYQSYVKMHNAAKQDWWEEREGLKAECERLVKDQRYSINEMNEANAKLTAIESDLENALKDNEAWESAHAALTEGVEKEADNLHRKACVVNWDYHVCAYLAKLSTRLRALVAGEEGENQC